MPTDAAGSTHGDRRGHDFCATLVDEWVRAGVTDAVVCPGSRSTPMALALAADDRMRVHVHHDERSAGVRGPRHRPGHRAPGGGAHHQRHRRGRAAPGGGRGPPRRGAAASSSPPTARPSCTASVRPRPSTRPTSTAAPCAGSPSPGVPDGAAPRLVAVARRRGRASRPPARRPGPVHLNLPFREPLVGAPGPLPAGRAGGAPWHERRRPRRGRSTDLGRAAPTLRGPTGVIVAGGGDRRSRRPSSRLADALGWPVLADPRSGLPGARAAVGRPTSTPCCARVDRRRAAARGRAAPRRAAGVQGRWASGWPARAPCAGRASTRDGALARPRPRRSTASLAAEPGRAAPRPSAAELEAGAAGGPTAGVERAGGPADDAAAGRASTAALAAHDGADRAGRRPRRRRRAARPAAALVVSSSMPVRDVEWFAAPAAGVRGAAPTGAPTASTASCRPRSASPSAGPAHRGAHRRRRLPARHQRAARRWPTAASTSRSSWSTTTAAASSRSCPRPALLAAERFEQLFGTPHGVDLAAPRRGPRPPVRRAASTRVDEVAPRSPPRSPPAASTSCWCAPTAPPTSPCTTSSTPPPPRRSARRLGDSAGRAPPRGGGGGTLLAGGVGHRRAERRRCEGHVPGRHRPGEVGVVVARARPTRALTEPSWMGSRRNERGVELGVGGHPGLGGAARPPCARPAPPTPPASRRGR